jgi:hypothetical protein
MYLRPFRHAFRLGDVSLYNCGCYNHRMRIEGLRQFRGGNPRGYFEDQPWEIRNRAYMWLNRLCERWKGDLPRWRFAILVGQAKRLARMSDADRSAWGRKMLAKRGGYAVQQSYRAEGRVGKAHPAYHAAQVSASRRRWKKTAKERERQGIKPHRHGFGNLQGI